jgi:hypothetical protein
VPFRVFDTLRIRGDAVLFKMGQKLSTRDVSGQPSHLTVFLLLKNLTVFLRIPFSPTQPPPPRAARPARGHRPPATSLRLAGYEQSSLQGVPVTATKRCVRPPPQWQRGGAPAMATATDCALPRAPAPS